MPTLTHDDDAGDLASQLQDIGLTTGSAQPMTRSLTDSSRHSTSSPPAADEQVAAGSHAEDQDAHGRYQQDDGDIGRVSQDLERDGDLGWALNDAQPSRDPSAVTNAPSSSPPHDQYTASDDGNEEGEETGDSTFEAVPLDDDVQTTTRQPAGTTGSTSPAASQSMSRTASAASAASTRPTTASASFTTSPTSVRTQPGDATMRTHERTSMDETVDDEATPTTPTSTNVNGHAGEDPQITTEQVLDASATGTEGALAAAPAAPTSPEISTKRRMSTKTPTIMQKVVSMTRQRDLPPKTKEEERKHLRQLEEMRTASKEAERKRKAQEDQAAAARQHKIDLAFSAWEQAILPNWRAVLHDTPEGKHLRSLWWQGTMPTRYRGRLWGLCIGNGLAISKTTLHGHVERARKAVNESKYPQAELEKLERDVQETLPTLKLFQKDGVMHDDLVDILLAFTVFQAGLTGQVRYPIGLACPGALLLVNMAPADAWVSLVNLVDKSFLKSFYGGKSDEMEAYYRIFDTLLADSMPKVYENFLRQSISPRLYLTPWLISLYVRFLPLDLATRIFDVFVLEGDSFLFRVALAILRTLESRLFNPNQTDIQAVFDGTDRGAVAIVKRIKQQYQRNRTGTMVDDDDIQVDVDEVYVEMGCTEQDLFETIQSMDWREDHFTRLCERELPDE
ncbi:hypothetical protein OIO90_000487 [Microbotryomycetes sp. JL221]|nr:hypothetical protein OIO90_000487 [Microbotryomycetes sp. JL221]